MRVLLAVFLTGCATTSPALSAPWTSSATPDYLKQAQSLVRAEMSYDFRSEHISGKDIWSGSCPAVGDCEDVALCMIEKLRQAGRSPKLYRMKWDSYRTPWAHMMVKDGNWYADYHGTVQTPDRLTPTHECHQVSTSPGQAAWSTKGAWVCTPVGSDSQYLIQVVL